VVRAAASALLVLAGVGVTSSAAGRPEAALVQAFQKTSRATSTNVTLTERIRAGGQTLATVRLSGIEQQRAQAGSFVFSFTPATGLGQATEIVHGSRVYVHFGLLDRLHARNPRIKHWVVVSSKSSLGLDPAGFTALGTNEIKETTGLHVVGSGTVGGTPVTRYAGTLDLRRAAASPQLQQLAAHLPSAARAILRGKEHLVIAVGSDGYVHRVTTSIHAPVAGTQLRVEVDAILGDFGSSPGAIVPPAASDVMTLAQFQRAVSASSAASGGTAAPAAGNTGLINEVVLKPSQVGSGYSVSVIPGGRQVQGQRTLDFCDRRYPSESLRTARLQVLYTKPGAPFKASNEVVTYRSGGAGQALREMVQAAATCPQGTVKHPPSGVSRLVRHSRRLPVHSGLLPGAVAILDSETGVVNGRRVKVETVAVFQVRRNVLSGVYGQGGSAAALQAATLRAAQRSAANLKRYVR
jgi:hypothetical protein